MNESLFSSQRYVEFRKKFLSPNEDNRGDISGAMDIMFNNLPSGSSGAPFIKSNNHNYRAYLEKFEKIPEKWAPANDALGAVSGILEWGLRFHSKAVLQNINQPVLLEWLAAGTVSNLYNFNLLWDYTSAGSQEAEQQIMRQLARLATWNTQNSDGVFTFGGKACFMYAIRIGLNRCIKNYSSEWIGDHKPVVVTSTHNHYLIENVCSLLWLWAKACERVPTDREERLDLNIFESRIRELLMNNIPIAAVILSGWSTINLNIDPVSSVVSVIDRLFWEFGKEYRPFVYLDTVVSWPWLFYGDYDFQINPWNLDQSVTQRIKLVTERLLEVSLADGFWVDFHKMGFASYNSSAFLVKNKKDLHSIFKDDRDYTVEKKGYWENFTQHHTLEHSRSVAPVLSVWTIFQSLGADWFRMYIEQMMLVGDQFKEILPHYGFVLINGHSLCHASVFYVKNEFLPEKYVDLNGQDENLLMNLSHYTFKFAEFLVNGGNDFENGIDVWFLKAIKKSSSWFDISAIRVFPMSPHLSVEDAQNMAHRIGKIKYEFDKEFEFHVKNSSVPEVVHR